MIKKNRLFGTKEIHSEILSLKGWDTDLKSLSRTIGFSDFSEACRFIYDFAPIADKKAHHPDFQLSYNKLTVSISTHELNGITKKDFELALEINTFLKNNYYGMVHEK